MKKLLIPFLLFSFSTAFAQDSATYFEFIKYPEVTKIFYVQKTYGNKKIKEEGWVVRYKNANESKIFRVKGAPPEQEFEFKIGNWKGYYKNGVASYTDTAFIASDSTGNIISYFDQKGRIIEKYYNYSLKEVDYINTSVPPLKAPYNNTLNSKDSGNISIHIIYYANGKIKSICKFCNTKPCGADKHFDENGKLEKEANH